VVTIRSLYVKAFEGSSADYAYATGFVVDAKHGLIMTNRHVVELGPSKQEAVFTKSKEEVELAPVWRDPIHDVGIMRFDPAAIKRSELVELPLNPEGAATGVEVRVTGNDAGEKLSVLSGTIARVDRAAPEYDNYGFNDFNTFYISAASNTSGGSSGSPVLNRSGEVIALNAGGATEAASSFYLPLFRARRALEMLRRNVDVSRGEALTEFHHEPFDEAVRLGARPETVAALRAAVDGETGMLKARRTVKAGPADGAVRPGDLLARVNGAYVSHFLPLEEAYDSTWTVRAAAVNALARVVGDEAAWGVPADLDAEVEAAEAEETKEGDGDASPAPAIRPPRSLKGGRAGVEPPVALSAEEAEAAYPSPGAAASAAAAAAAAPPGAPLEDPTPFLPAALTDRLRAALAAAGFEEPPTDEDGASLDRREPLPQDLPWAALRSFHASVPPSPALLGGIERLAAALEKAAPALDGLPAEERGAALASALRASLGLAPDAPLADAVPAALDVEVERGGATSRSRVHVTDLHATLPGEFLEISGSVIHALTLHQRLNYEVPMGPGVVVASAGYMLGNGFVSSNSVITGVETASTSTLDSLEAALCAIPDGERFAIRYFALGENQRETVQVLEMDRRFHAASRWVADRREGLWHPRPCAEAPAPPAAKPQRTTLAHPGDDTASRAFNSLVVVEFSMPVLTDAVSSGSYFGAGVVVDAAAGLIVVDRNTVPTAIGDVRITVAGSVELRGTVRYLHPYHNFAVVSYDPARLETDRPVEPVPFASRPAEVGEDLLFVGTTADGEAVAHGCVVTKVQRTSIGDASPPRFRAFNGEAVHVDRMADCLGGLLIREAAEEGGAPELVAVIGSYSAYESSSKPNTETLKGMPVAQMQGAVESLRRGEEPFLASFDVEMHLTPLSMARQGLGLPADWCERVEKLSTRRQVLAVTRAMPGLHGGAGILREGDLLLAVGGEPVTTFQDVDDAVATACAPAASSGSADLPSLDVTVLRDRELLTLGVTPRRLPNQETTRIVSWAGALLQDTPRATRIRGYVPHGHDKPGVYVSRWAYGSVAHKYSVRRRRRPPRLPCRRSFVVQVPCARASPRPAPPITPAAPPPCPPAAPRHQVDHRGQRHARGQP